MVLRPVPALCLARQRRLFGVERPMSYDISLCDPVTHEVLELTELHFIQGGTYALGGTKVLWLNVTYNYARWYYKPGVFAKTKKESQGIRTIYGMTGAESIPVLEKAIAKLEDMTADISDRERRECEAQECTGYWMPTRENAVRPLYQLLAFARMRPDGIWEGD